MILLFNVFCNIDYIIHTGNLIVNNHKLFLAVNTYFEKLKISVGEFSQGFSA